MSGLGERAQNAAIAQVKQKAARDILNGIDRWKSSRVLTAKRRWIFELLQNAVDTARARKKGSVRIKISRNGGSLTFSHNGGFFTLDEVNALIYGGSTKPYEPGSEYLGRFGTGFLVTHVVSRAVEIRGYVREDNCNYQIQLKVNREHDKEDEMMASIDGCFRQLDKAEPCEDARESWTEFVYTPKDQLGTEAVQEGIAQLKQNLGLVFAFNDIEEITIDDESYAKEVSEFGPYTRIVAGDSSVLLKPIAGKSVQIGIVTGDKCITSLEGRPTIFLGMPLTESADYVKIPFVINCPRFEPDQERASLKHSETNEEYLRLAFNEYPEFLLEFVASPEHSTYSGTYHLIDFHEIPVETVGQNPL